MAAHAFAAGLRVVIWGHYLLRLRGIGELEKQGTTFFASSNATRNDAAPQAISDALTFA